MPLLHPLHAQVSSTLQQKHGITVNEQWLNAILTSQGHNPPPLPALTSTVNFRLLASDITTSITSTTATDALPPHASEVNVKHRQLQGTVIVQVLDVIDVGSSKWSQVEAIERVERGEEVRGREVVRTVDGLDADLHESASNNNTSATNTNKKLTAGPHKLLIQDARGTKVLAFELEKIPKIGIAISAGAVLPTSTTNQGAASSNTIAAEDPGMFIGCKLLLRPGTVIRRGMVMLTAENCQVLGGKVQTWDQKWREERKQRLTALVMEERAAAQR